jgi:hypothetical protein
MDPLSRTCGKCRAALVIDNVTDGPGTKGYVVGYTNADQMIPAERFIV